MRYGHLLLSDMLDNVEGMGIVDTGATYRNLRVKHDENYGEIDRTAFKMPRSAIMMEKGAGRGWRKNPSARTPRPWFSQAMVKLFPKLADELGKAGADEMAKQIDLRDKPSDARGMTNYRINL